MARYRKTEDGWARTSGGSSDAINIDYDNSKSGLRATNVQNAIDEQKQELTNFADEGYVAKNLIPHPYAYNFPYTYNGITFDEIGGGCLRLNGTNANANNYCNFTSTVMQGAWADKLIDGKTYCYSVEFVSGSGTISAYINNGQKDLLAMRNFSDTNRGTFVYEKGSELTVAFYITANQILNNLVIRPMIVEVDANGNYPTSYTMYAPSNIDLGSDVTNLKSDLNKKRSVTNPTVNVGGAPDFNTFTENGEYGGLLYASNITNAPQEVSALGAKVIRIKLTVYGVGIDATQTKVQELEVANTDNGTINQYTRVMVAGAWKPWDENALKSKLKWRIIGSKVAPSSIKLADLDVTNNTELFVIIHINNGDWWTPSGTFPLGINYLTRMTEKISAEYVEVEYLINMWDANNPIRIVSAKDAGADATSATTITVAVR